ncbi:hypothetical protein EOL96_08930 [Candidatus Saccharibacteria bacterium]|nr:hypothetical protein [Candidatus Saccharibacteria bacterium]
MDEAKTNNPDNRLQLPKRDYRSADEQANTEHKPQPQRVHSNNLAPSAVFLDELKTSAPIESSKEEPAPETNDVISNDTPDSAPEHSTGDTFEEEYRRLYPEARATSQDTTPGELSVEPHPPALEKVANGLSYIPLGIKIIVGFTVLNAMVTLITLGTTELGESGGGTMVFGVVFPIMLAVGLLMGSNVSRVLFIVAGLVGAYMAFTNILGLMSYQESFYAQKELVQSRIQQLENESRLTSEEKAQLDRYREAAISYGAVSDAAFMQYYAMYTMNFLYGGFLFIYLIRPSTKKNFERF